MQQKLDLRPQKLLQNAKSWEADIITADTNKKQASIALKLAQKRLNDATIIAPIDGIVSQRHLDLGGMAVPTAPLFEIVDTDIVNAKVDVIESQLSQISLNQQTEIIVEGINRTNIWCYIIY